MPHRRLRVAHYEALPAGKIGTPGTFTGETRGPRGGFTLAETLVQNERAGDNATAGGTLHQPVLYTSLRFSRYSNSMQ